MTTQVSEIKKTALYDVHVALGAKIIPFAGYDMPVSYSGITDEHNTVRNSVGVFDVSHMGEFFVEGLQAFDLIQYVTTNDVSKLFPGRVQYSCLPNISGGIVDDLLVYKITDTKYMLVVNASNIEKDWSWINSYAEAFDCKLTNVSDEYSLLAIQGPKACEAMQPLTAVDVINMPYYHFELGQFAGFDEVFISATGYTGSGGLEIYIKNEHAVELWHRVFEAGASFGIKPAGLGARDTLRLEKGFCLYGNDINDQTSPIEAGLGWITKFDKDFVNKDYIQNQKLNGTVIKLVGLEILDRIPGRQHDLILDEEGNQIGEITSGTITPTIGKPIAMAYVPTQYAKIGTKLTVKVASRDKKMDAIVTKIPFLA